MGTVPVMRADREDGSRLKDSVAGLDDAVDEFFALLKLGKWVRPVFPVEYWSDGETGKTHKKNGGR